MTGFVKFSSMNTPASSPRRRAVIFDIGGVLLDWNPRHLYRKLIADEAVMEDLLARVFTQIGRAHV